MRSVAEIEQAIAKLSAREFVELERWFDEERNRKWDHRKGLGCGQARLSFGDLFHLRGCFAGISYRYPSGGGRGRQADVGNTF
jgi:hypothetical protein